MKTALDNNEFPHSRILAKVKILDCVKLDAKINKAIINENKLVYGNKYDRTGYAWKLDVIKKITNNQDISGKQGIWNI